MELYNITKAAKLKNSESSEEVIRFYHEYPWLFNLETPGVGIRVVEVEPRFSPVSKLIVIVEISDFTQTRQIIKAAPIIAEYQDCLMKFRGVDLSSSTDALEKGIMSDLKENGVDGEKVTYGTLAKEFKMEKDKVKDIIRNWQKRRLHKFIKAPFASLNNEEDEENLD